MQNDVLIKGKKDRLEIALNPNIDFFDLCEAMLEKIKQTKKFIGSSELAIEFTGRLLSSEQENELINIITSNSDINIIYVFSERIPMSTTNSDIPKLISEEGNTHFYKGTLRSGSKLEFEGNIVIVGDVNPGAIVRAKGNVIVIGHLNGTVFAGLGGDTNSFIGAMYLNPIQMTIGIISTNDFQKEILDSNRVNKDGKFRFARIKNQEIIIEECV